MICPRCRKNKRALVDELDSGRFKQRYAPFCHLCMVGDGYVLCQATLPTEAVVTWYEKPVTVGGDDVTDDELFEMYIHKDASLAKAKAEHEAWATRGGAES